MSGRRSKRPKGQSRSKSTPSRKQTKAVSRRDDKQLSKLLEEVKAAAAERREQRKQERFQKLLRGLRVRKSDKGKLLLIDTKGKRIDKRDAKKLARTQVFVVRVNRSGKKSFLQERRGQKTYKPKKLVSWKIIRTGRRDEKGFYVNLRPTFTKLPRIVPTPGERRRKDGVKFERAVSGIVKDVQRRGRTRGNVQLVVEVTVKIRGHKPRTFVAEFKARYNQRISPTMVQGMAWGTFWPQIADWLDGLGLVAKGSAAFVSRLGMNKGKPRKDWQIRYDGKPQPWGKGDLPEAGFEWISWDIKRIAVGNEGQAED